MNMIKKLCRYLAIIVMAITIYFAVELAIKLFQLPPIPDSVPVKTHPTDGPVTFFIVGDTGSGLLPQQAVANAMKRRCQTTTPDALLLLGDLVYPDGVTSLSDPLWQSRIFDMYTGNCLTDIPIYPVLGNHDYYGDTQSWLNISQTHPRWWYPFRHYLVQYSDIISIFAVDTNFPTQIKRALPQINESNRTPWTLLIGHHPIISESAEGGRHKGGTPMDNYLKKLFCHKADSYISGHAHHMEHIFIDGCHMDQYIAGSGSKRTPFIDQPTHEFGLEDYGYLEVVATPNQLDFRFMSLENDVLYETTRKK